MHRLLLLLDQLLLLLDRPGLEQHGCECYAVVRDELARLLFSERYRQDALPGRAGGAPQVQHLTP